MKFKLLCFLSAFLAVILGLKTADSKDFISQPEFPLTEHKSFAVVVYGYNQADWCERSLRSIVSQEYDHFRVIFIDDASIDGTKTIVESFISDNHQQHRVLALHNESHLGEATSLYRVIDTLLDKEIVLPLRGKDWLTHPNVLQDLNKAYQNPDVWLTSYSSLVYPTYVKKESYSSVSFYSALFKQIKLCDLIRSGAYLTPLTELAGKHVQKLMAPLVFDNVASPSLYCARLGSANFCGHHNGPFFDDPSSEILLQYSSPHDRQNLSHSEDHQNLQNLTAHSIPRFISNPSDPYQPLDQFPKVVEVEKYADILVFSCDRPLQLYACLESIDRYMSGFDALTVLYRASNERFAAGYRWLKTAFPKVRFLAQSSDYKKDFKPLLMKAVFHSPSKYILFGVDDIIVKDFIKLAPCMELMEKTGAYGFYLRFGKHISYCYQSAAEQPVPLSIPLVDGVYAWSFDSASYDWGFPNSLDMTLYRKEDLKEPFENLKFKTPNSLEFCWANGRRPKGAIGLYFENSKIVNIPFNVVSRTNNPHMNYLTVDELLVKFEEGLKMNIDPLYKIANSSPHFEYLPEFILR